MNMQFRNDWNQAPPRFQGAPDAPMIPMLTPTEASVRDAIHEAYNYGGFANERITRMFQAALSPRGAIVSIRAGAHQIEDMPGGGFRLHIGALFEGTNFHLNIAQTIAGTMYITSISWGTPNTPDFGVENRTGGPPPV